MFHSSSVKSHYSTANILISVNSYCWPNRLTPHPSPSPAEVVGPSEASLPFHLPLTGEKGADHADSLQSIVSGAPFCLKIFLSTRQTFPKLHWIFVNEEKSRSIFNYFQTGISAETPFLHRLLADGEKWTTKKNISATQSLSCEKMHKKTVFGWTGPSPAL